MKVYPKFTFRTLKRAPQMRDSIVAVYRKGAAEGEMPVFIGPRHKVRAFVQSAKQKG